MAKETEIANYAKDKQLWNPSIAAHKLPNDDDDYDFGEYKCFCNENYISKNKISVIITVHRDNNNNIIMKTSYNA